MNSDQIIEAAAKHLVDARKHRVKAERLLDDVVGLHKNSLWLLWAQGGIIALSVVLIFLGVFT